MNATNGGSAATIAGHGGGADARVVEEQVTTAAGEFVVRSVRGVAAAEPILLVHGMWSASFLWDQILLGLSGRSRYPVSVDLLGHGRSAAPDRLFTIPDHAAALLALADALGWQQVTLVGNSMGSLISLAAAAARPKRVDRLITFGCPAWASEEERRDWLHARTGYVDLETGMPRPRPPHDDSPTGLALAANYPRIGIWILNSMWAIYAYDLMGDLGRLSVDFEAWYGENDFLAPTARNLGRAKPRRVGRIAAAGHNAPMENPAAVTELLAATLREADAADPHTAGTHTADPAPADPDTVRRTGL